MNQTALTVADDLKRAHRAIFQDVKKLTDAIRVDSGIELADLRTRLKATLAHATDHFHLEEKSGFMDSMADRDPRLEHAVEKLRGEHDELKETLRAIIVDSTQVSQFEPVLRSRIHDWIARFRHHEYSENDLVQDAFNYDLGAED